jgi:hypothetical protein
MQVDVSPVVQSVIGLCAVALTVLGGIALQVVAAKWKVQLSASQSAEFDAALSKALTYGATTADAEIRAKGWDHPDVKNAVVATALTYAVAKFPDAIAAVGLSTDLTNPTNVATITAALQRALPAAMLTASASPATPPAPATPKA